MMSNTAVLYTVMSTSPQRFFDIFTVGKLRFIVVVVLVCLAALIVTFQASMFRMELHKNFTEGILVFPFSTAVERFHNHL